MYLGIQQDDIGAMGRACLGGRSPAFSGAQGGATAGLMANSANRRSSKITTMPLVTTIAAPMTSVAEGEADQKIQSIPKAHRIAVYSNGPTTDGGARRNASVSHS